MPERIRINTQFTAGKFMHTEDALNLGKIRLFAGTFAGGQMTGHLAHFLDADDARVISQILAGGAEIEFTDFKGKESRPPGGGKAVVSSKLRINLGKNGVYFFEFAAGPGRRTGHGIVEPVGKPARQVNFFLGQWQARRWGAAVHEYLLAWQVARMLAHHRHGEGEPPLPLYERR